MNREILFRGKRKSQDKDFDGEWVYGDLFHNLVYDGRENEVRIGDVYFDKDTNDEIHGTGCVLVYFDTLGEYTGLTDKNGNKIFEGDIVQAPSNLAGTEFYIGAIEFGNFDDYNGNIYTGFFIRWHNVPQYSTLRQSIVWWRDEKDRFLEVIGNIYDNSELLTDKND